MKKVDERKAFIKNRVTDLCKHLGVSDRQMSLAIGKGENYIGKIKAGEFVPPLLVLYEICEYSGIEMEDFFATDSSPLLLSKLTKTARKLNEEELQAVLNIASAFEKKNNE